MQVRRNSQYKRSNPFGKMIVSFVALTCASFCIAWAWQSAEDGKLEVTDRGEASASQSVEDIPIEAASIGSESPAPPDLSAVSLPYGAEIDTDTGEGAVSADFSRPKSDNGGKESVDKSYFDDALFIGDSISAGIPGYHIADNAAVVAFTGINTDSINHREVIDTPEGRITMLEAAKRKAPRSKIYIMLGGNGLDFDKDTFISGYRAFVTSIREAYPNAVVYLQSMTPVTKNVSDFYSSPNITNERIREYNDAIMELARSMGLHYLDVYSVLADEDGMLPEEASPTDGMHFSPEYYYKWFDYLRTNTVEAN